MRDVLLVAAKDLRIERRSRIGTAQVLPFALLVLLLFAFALDPDRGLLEAATPGLFWVTVLFSAVLALQRNFGIEAEDGIIDALRLCGMAPSSIYFGKVLALVVQLFALEFVLVIAVAVFYNLEFNGIPLLVVISLAATLGIAATGSIYGALSARLRSRDTLLPLLMLPLLAPVLISATRGSEIALRGEVGTGWSWAALLGLFASTYLIVGAVLFSPLLEDA
ncbi:MAG: heme exporter protein CcmB [Microthrixaceae bacterium]|nr:heme exporter protein CcmB [Microthrixaceae bacterium]